MLRSMFASAQDAINSAPALIDRAKALLADFGDDEDEFFATRIAPHLSAWAVQVATGDDGSLADALAEFAKGGSITGPCGPVLAAHLEWSPVPKTRNWSLSLHATLASRAGDPVHRVASWETPWDELPDTIRSAVIRKSIKCGRLNIVTALKEA